MGFATARTVTLSGATGHLIDVQVDLAHGLVATTLVGRPDASINEARDRCRAALTNSGFEWPTSRRVTILLSPADLPKSGSHFDLSIAVATLAAAQRVPRSALERVVFVGELTLDGRLRAVPGVLPMTLAARNREMVRVVVPEPQADEAALVPGMDVTGVRSLQQVVAHLRNEPIPDAPPVEPLSSAAPRRPAGGAFVGRRPALLARRPADRRPRHVRRARHGRRPVRAGGCRFRWPSPHAERAQGCGQDHARRADPGAASGPDPGGVPGAQCDLFAGRWAARGRRQDPPTALSGAPPLGLAGEPPRRRHCAGAAR